jgi:3-isopropylmalate/(R)-2-methylmalate dehydratase small subunit
LREEGAVSLERIESVFGRGIVVRGDDIDTDVIIPARFMRTITFDGLEEHVFADVRRDPEGRPKGHPFDSPRFAGASILVVNRNFGCGSSREHAPQALGRWGIRAIVGESFAEIFFGNCIALGIPAVTAPRDEVYRLMDAVELDPEHRLELDLGTRALRFRSGTLAVEIPDWALGQLLEGTWDATSTLLVARDAIRETARRLPYVKGF